MLGGAIWHISPLAGPLPFAGVPHGLAIHVVEIKYIENYSEENDDDNSIAFYAPLPMSYINDLFSAKTGLTLKKGSRTLPPLNQQGVSTQGNLTLSLRKWW